MPTTAQQSILREHQGNNARVFQQVQDKVRKLLGV
jgi:hypothetical protein